MVDLGAKQGAGMGSVMNGSPRSKISLSKLQALGIQWGPGKEKESYGGD